MESNRPSRFGSVPTLFGVPEPSPEILISHQEEPSQPPAGFRWRGWILAAGILVFALAVSFWAFLHLGSWLIVQDPLQQAHAIVVLSGRMPARALEAARVYKQNVAIQVWVSKPVSPAATLERMNIAFVGEEFYNQKALIVQGVPADSIRVFEQAAANTEEEVDEIARELRRDDAHSVIIVTSKPHTRRVRLIWKRRVGSDPKAIIRYVSDDSFDASHWWRHTSDALDVVREWLGIANAEMGFPSIPAPH
jgi:uncharacterized SAM-binding protein YcdF (DUF218 family)